MLNMETVSGALPHLGVGQTRRVVLKTEKRGGIFDLIPRYSHIIHCISMCA